MNYDQPGLPYKTPSSKKEKKSSMDWRCVSVVKSTGRSSKGSGVDSQNIHGGSQLSVTPFPKDLMPSSSNQICMRYTGIHEGKAPYNIK